MTWKQEQDSRRMAVLGNTDKSPYISLQMCQGRSPTRPRAVRCVPAPGVGDEEVCTIAAVSFQPILEPDLKKKKKTSCYPSAVFI